MTTITGTLLTASGQPIAGATVTGRLVAASGLLAAGGEIVRSTSTTTAADGSWALTLTPISSLAYPVGAYYVIEGAARRHTITVPDTGTYPIATVLVDVPDERDEVGLTQHVADGRYLSLEGGTLTGALVLAGNPSHPLHAATREYVDAGGSGGTYTHTQSTPATVWAVTHGLGFRPNVAVLSTTGEEVDAAVAWPTLDTVTISLAASMTGTAHLS